MRETEWQDQVVQLARLYGWRVAHFRPVRVTRRDGSTFHQTAVQYDGAGFPDLVLAHPDMGLIFAEMKSDTGIVRPEQRAWLASIPAVDGVIAEVWRPRDFDHVRAVLSDGVPFSRGR